MKTNLMENAIVERTGFKPGDRVKPWCARVYTEDSARPMVVAYGDTEQGALAALESEFNKETL